MVEAKFIDRLVQFRTIILSLMLIITLNELLLAEEIQSSQNVTSQDIHLQFIPVKSPDKKGTPPSRNGTGSRGNCPRTNFPLIPLVGSQNLELTASEHPTIWIYIPYTLENNKSGQFSLQDENDKIIYQTEVILSEKVGIVSIPLPVNQPPLSMGKKYRWYFEINCFSQGQNSAAFVTGLVQRVSLSSEIKRQLDVAKTPLERIQIYAKNGIWYDMLTNLAQLYRKNPELKAVWTDLLKQVNLENIANEPLLN